MYLGRTRIVDSKGSNDIPRRTTRSHPLVTSFNTVLFPLSPFFVNMAETSGPSIQRGDYRRSKAPILIFSIGRAITGPLQYLLITAHPLSALGIRPPPTGSPPITILGHSFPRLPFLTALMPGVLSLKHLIWLNFLMRERMTMKFAAFGIIADFLFESVTSLVFTAASVNPLFSERYFYTAITMFFSSVALELAAELQRTAFKSKKENEGKVCKTGFWGITRHINYTANVLFGFAYGLATGGPVYGIATGAFYLSNFVLNAIPGIEEYCRGKYGEQWAEYEKEVPWQLFPGIY
jgi:protein-S-isoprenylcysteine O-methyltransferase Ste14